MVAWEPAASRLLPAAAPRDAGPPRCSGAGPPVGGPPVGGQTRARPWVRRAMSPPAARFDNRSPEQRRKASNGVPRTISAGSQLSLRPARHHRRMAMLIHARNRAVLWLAGLAGIGLAVTLGLALSSESAGTLAAAGGPAT